MQRESAPLIVASDGHPFRMMTDSDKFNFIKHIRNDLFKYEGEDEDWEEMNDYERFEVRRMLLMQQTERQKELAESRYAPERDPEMIMGYERFMFANTFNQRLGNLERGNEGFNYIDPLATFHIADSWWESEKRVVDCFNNPVYPAMFNILTREESEAKRRSEMPPSDDEEVIIAGEMIELSDSEEDQPLATSSNQRNEQASNYQSVENQANDKNQPGAGPSRTRSQEEVGEIEELVVTGSDDSSNGIDPGDRMDLDQEDAARARSRSSQDSRDHRGFANDSEIDSGEEGDEDDRARSPTPPISEVRRGKKRALSISSESAHQLPTPRLTTSRSVSLQKPSPTRPSKEEMLGPAEIETAQEEERDLRGKIVMRTTRGKQTGATRTVRVNRVRTDFNPRQMKPLPPNPSSESHLREFFFPDLKSTQKAVFYLSDFEVTSAPNNFIDLSSLFDMKSGFEIAGSATPVHDRSVKTDDSDGSHDETDGPDDDETRGRVKRVCLYCHDSPKLTLTLRGYTINTKHCRFILQHPTQSYRDYTLDASMLLNVWAFARSKRIRGAFSLEEEEEEEEAVTSVARQVRRQLAALKKEPLSRRNWQRALPPDWRCATSKLILEDKLCQLLFQSLPNIPWTSPKIYSSIEPHFLPFSTRTDDPSKDLASNAALERTRDIKHLGELAKSVKAWKNAPVVKSVVLGDVLQLLQHPDPVERSEQVRLFQTMVIHDDPIDKQKRTLYRIGDVVLVSPPFKRVFRLHKSQASVESGLQATDDELETSEEESEATSDKDEAEEVPKQNSIRLLWFARIESIFQSATRVKAEHEEEEEEEDEESDASDLQEVQLHLTYFTLGDVIPSVGTYFCPRQLFLLDSCTSIAASTIVKKVEYKELRPGEAVPEEGFYCRSTYNDQDGSIQDLGTSRSYDHCDQAQISHCDSCEKDLAFAAASEVKDESVSEEENQNEEEEEEAKDQKWTPIRLDDDDKDSFRYANHCYHPNDFILLSPNPNSETLPDASPSDRRHTLRLAQLLSLTPALSPTPSQSPGVTNLGRASSLKVRWIVRRSETGKVGKDQTKFEREVFLTDIVEEEVDVNRLEGSFRLHHLDEIRKLTKNSNDAEASVLYDAEDPFNFFYTSKIQRRDGPPLQVSQSHEKLTSHHSQLQEIVMRAGSVERCEICEEEEEKSRNDRRRVDDKLRGNQRGRPVMKNLSLYSGGGGLDKGMGMGCRVFRTKQAVETNRAAACVFRANHDDADVARVAASDYIEDIFYGRRDRTFFASITAGAPCQGFSSANRYKKADDVRCMEPFVFLTSLDVVRPLYATFENVRGFLDHSLPAPGSQRTRRQSFFQLFVATAIKIGYQLRWSLSNAAGFGSPQDRRRLIVQFALPGVPLPAVPRSTHAYKNAVHPFDHRLRDESWKKQKMNRTSSGYGVHPAVIIKDAIGDLPSFSVNDLFDKKTKKWEYRPFGFSWSRNPATKTKYPQPLPFTSYQLRSRATPNLDSSNQVTFSNSVTHHICGTPSPLVLERLRKLGIKGVAGKQGNHEDLKGLPCQPHLAPWLQRASESRKNQFWSRLVSDAIVATLRTTLNIDGSSHGSRIHYDQARWLSLRELMRIQGLPDNFEMLINYAEADTAIVDMIRIIGNGVPVPLAEAFGRSLADVVYPLINEELSSSNPPRPNEDLFERIWRERCAGDQLIVDANHPVVPVAPVQQENFGGYVSDGSDCIVMTP